MEGALIQVLNIFAGYRSVDLRDDVSVTHPHLETNTGLQTLQVLQLIRKGFISLINHVPIASNFTSLQFCDYHLIISDFRFLCRACGMAGGTQ